MYALRHLPRSQVDRIVLKSFGRKLTALCRTQPVQLVFKRNASIHTRNFFVQKLKLEHTTNFGITLLVLPVLTFGLGIWQISRKIQKEKLIADLYAKMSAEPIEIPKDLQQLNGLEYAVVKMRGEFLHEEEVHLGPRTIINPGNGGGSLISAAPKSGYLIITPFRLEGNNDVILVNRGWVPKSGINPKTRPESPPTGVVEMKGIVRKNETRPQFMPKMPLKGRHFAWKDLHRMSELTGAKPYLIDASSHSSVPGGPIGGQTIVTIRNEHLSYIFTWFSLSGLGSYMWYRLVYLVPK